MRSNAKSPLAGQAYYRAGECRMAGRSSARRRSSHFAVFRDQAPFQNLPGVTDRALLRLGHALAQQKQWDAEPAGARAGSSAASAQSPWVHEARYGIGWAWQNQKQYDQAVNAYSR